MAENIDLNVRDVLNLLSSVRATNPDTEQRMMNVLRMILNRETFTIGDLETVVAPIVQRVSAIQTNLGAIMATLAEFQTALSRIDTATTTAAAVLKEVRDRVAELETSAGISADDEASVLTQLDQVAAALEQMAQTPEEPVPVEPVPPVEPEPVPPPV